MNIVFFGNTKYSTIVAQKLQKEIGLSLIVTIPDKPIGRKQIVTPSPTKIFADSYNIPVITTTKLHTDINAQIANYHPDFLIVADYGLLLPKHLLELPIYAPLNVHHSLLPQYRGPSPAPSAILAGEKVTGVTIIEMIEQMDAGPILAQELYTLQTKETTDSLLTQLNTMGSKLLLPIFTSYKNNTTIKISQVEEKATFTKRMKKEDGYIDVNHPPLPHLIDRMIRAYYPWPGVWTTTTIAGKNTRVKFLPDQRIQIEGKKAVSYKECINGYKEIIPLLEQLALWQKP